MPETLDTAIERIVGQLGRYYGATSRSDFVSMLLLRSTDTQSSAFEIPDPTPARTAAQALLDVTEGGFTTPALVQKLNELVGSADEAQGDNDIPSLIKICYEPALLGDRDNNARSVLRSDTRPNVRLHDSNYSSQGYKKPGDDDAMAFSLKHIGGFGINARTTHAGDARTTVSVNETGAPTTDSTHVDCSIIQVFANRLAPASRDMGALTLFMNAIPTIEMSKAVPFIDMVLVQEGRHMSPEGPSGAGRVSSLSLGQFFLGNTQVNEGTTQYSIMNANDAVVAAENDRLPEFERAQRDSAGRETETLIASPISTAGIELFISPQTMVNADEDHAELDAFTNNGEEQIRRQSPIIDKFRPLMSLKSLSLQVVGTGGMMSYKTAKMSLVVHDRSRLAEVSALVRPARFGSTHIMLEYGWSHPDSPAQSGFVTANQDNLYGSLIGALRVKEKYQIINSSFDFDDTGQVNVEIHLSMLASRALQRAQIGLGLDNVPAFQEVKHITDMIKELRGRMGAGAAQAVFGESDVLGSLTNPQGATTPLSAEAVTQIRRLIAMRSNRDASPDLIALGTSLQNLMGSSGNGQGGSVENMRSQMRQKIRDRIRDLVSTSDPFLVQDSPSSSVRFPNYISLGKIFSSFLLEPITASGDYKDVQIIFYNFNDKASYMANRNIATFPIKKSDFSDVLTRELDQLVNMPVESFINFIGTYFLSDPGADAYGFNSAYGNRSTDSDGDSQRQLSEQYKENDAALFSFQQQVMKTAYGRTDGELEFKHPTVSVIMESVPVRSGEAGGTPDQTILRMHIVDSQATAHSTVQSFLEAASSQTIGLLNASAISAQQALGRTTAPISTTTTSQEASLPSVASARDDFDRAMLEAQRINLLEPYPLGSAAPAAGDAEGGSGIRRTATGEVITRYRIKGGFGALKSFIMRTVPSVRYGEGTSGIISAKVTSMNDSALSTVNMIRQGRNPETPTGAREQGLPLTVSPVECSLETIGCPLWSFGQQIFIDFGTGTTIDSIYGVTGVDHTIEPGNFKTTVKLTPMNSYARYTSLVNNIENALTAISGITGTDMSAPAAPPRPRSSRRRTTAPTTSASAMPAGAVRQDENGNYFDVDDNMLPPVASTSATTTRPGVGSLYSGLGGRPPLNPFEQAEAAAGRDPRSVESTEDFSRRLEVDAFNEKEARLRTVIGRIRSINSRPVVGLASARERSELRAEASQLTTEINQLRRRLNPST